MYEKDSFRIVEHRYGQEDLREISNWWMERLRSSIFELPSEWIDRIHAKLAAPNKAAMCPVERKEKAFEEE